MALLSSSSQPDAASLFNNMTSDITVYSDQAAAPLFPEVVTTRMLVHW